MERLTRVKSLVDEIRKISLVDRVTEVLRREISAGTWLDWLPSERALGETLQISRNTLRAALSELKRRKIIQSVHPRGTRILGAPAVRRRASRTGIMGLLSPQPLNLLRPNVALIIDALRAHLAEIGYRLHLHHGERYWGPQSGPALQKLTRANKHDCWVLVLANDAMKRWFQSAAVPCVVSGSCAPDIRLPFVDLDYYALGRHAAGQMLAAGHRRVGLLVQKSTQTGKLECERGFREFVENSAHEDAKATVFYHTGLNSSVRNVLDRMRNMTHRPTSLLVVNPNNYLLALTYCQKRGLRVPNDICLVCADDDPFLAHVWPEPSRYAFNTKAFSRRLFRLTMEVSRGSALVHASAPIIPDYIRGATLASLSN